MKVLQVLPELNSGGVERGTLDLARYLVEHDHQSCVMSAGGAMVAQLLNEGSEHIQFAVHKKSLRSLLLVKQLRQCLIELNPDLIHVRSRVPAWLVYLALRKWPLAQKPALVSTFHGLYSTNRYSEIMGCGDQVIAISQCVKAYIIENYPRINASKITVVPRGVDTKLFTSDLAINEAWQSNFYDRNPNAKDKPIVLMPGRITRWKGQLAFIRMMADLIASGHSCHGLIVGGGDKDSSYMQELLASIEQRDVKDHVTLLGHSDDMEQLYALSSVVCNLSQHAEPFGRTVIEALAVGTPVVSYNYGGPAESLSVCFEEGLVDLNDEQALQSKVAAYLHTRPLINLAPEFTLAVQAQSTLDVYDKALGV